jgi:hypothetical protein
MPDTIFSQIIPLTAAMALPFPVLKGTRLLLAGKPVAHSMIFILTWGITCFLVLSSAVIWKAIILEFFGVFANYTLPEKFSGWVHIILGLLFIGLGVKKLKLGLEQKSAPVVQQSIEITAFFIITSTVKRELFKLKSGLLLLLMIHILLSSEMTYTQSLIASGMISTTAMIWVSMPLLVYFWMGNQRDAALEALKQWLIANNATLIIFIYLFIGISILSSGIEDLIPELLEVVFKAAK